MKPAIREGAFYLTDTGSRWSEGRKAMVQVLRIIPAGPTVDGRTDQPRALVLRWNCPWVDEVPEELDGIINLGEEERGRYQVPVLFQRSETKARTTTMAALGRTVSRELFPELKPAGRDRRRWLATPMPLIPQAPEQFGEAYFPNLGSTYGAPDDLDA